MVVILRDLKPCMLNFHRFIPEALALALIACLSEYFCSINSKLWPLVSNMKIAHMMVQSRADKAKK